MFDHQQKIDWIINQHRETNHMYDKYLPYEFHLRMVVEVFRKFQRPHIIPPYQFDVELACWGHDLIEDTRVSYNDVLNVLGQNAADIVYALTNEKGKTRSERANDKYYELIRNTSWGVFCKLCDRIANVQYSKMSGSRQFDMYRKENSKFVMALGYHVEHPLLEMFEYLDNLLK